MIRKKLRAESGASISFALLIFLVCAVVSAVVLVAATTAVGRISNVAKTDQRYYAVTSAAELIKSSLEDPVSVFKVNGRQYAFDRPMNQIANADISMEEDTAADPPATPAEGEETDPVTPGYGDAAGLKKTLALAVTSDASSMPVELKVSSNIPGIEDELDAQINGRIDDSGRMTLTVSKDGFRLDLMLEADVTDENPPVTVHEGVTISDAHEVAWHLTRIATPYDVGK